MRKISRWVAGRDRVLCACWLGLLASNASAVYVEFAQNAVNDANSNALAAVSSSQWLETGQTVTTVTAPEPWSGYRFTHWTVSGTPTDPLRDPWGRAQNPASFTLSQQSTATAHYLLSTLDSDTDGVPDWYTVHYFGTPSLAATSDTDNDGLTLLQEFQQGSHPLYANTNQVFGIAKAQSGLVTCNLAGYPQYILRSEPTGTVNQAAIAVPGAAITTPNMTQTTFGFWTLDSVQQRDAWGAAIRQLTFTVTTSNCEAVAYLFTGDSDTDGVPDAWEQFYFNTLSNGGGDDPNSDGFTLLQDYQASRPPVFKYAFQPGGIAKAQSALVTCNLARYPQYTLRSEPAGTVNQTAIVVPGTSITTPNMTQTTFGFWTLDGEPQRDAWGTALRQLTFPVATDDREAVAYLFTGDSDADSLPDAWELYYFNTLAYSSATDLNSDSFTLLQDYQTSRPPVFKYAFQPGGISKAQSSLVQFVHLYTLTVTNGTGSGAYQAGEVISITASNAPAGQLFDRWGGDTQGVASVTSSSTTVTMPPRSVILTAIYTNILYTLTVTHGTGSSTYPNGAVVPITANTPLSGQEFDRWTGSTQFVASVTSAVTSVTMPIGNISVTATYKDILYTLTVTGGTGSGSYTNGAVVPIAANTPPSGQEFDRWTGATQLVASVTSAVTTVTMPAQAISLTSAYKLISTSPKAITSFKVTTANSGSLVNSPTWVTGKFGNALSFSNGKYVTVPAPSPDIFNITGDLTIALWVNPNSLTCSGADPAFDLVAKRTSNSATPYELYIGNGGSVHFNYWATYIAYPIFTATATITTGKWYHIAVTRSYTGNTATVKFYIDGVAAGSSTAASGPALGSSAPVWLSRGPYHAAYTSQGTYSGLMDAVQIYNRALSAQEISRIVANTGASISNRVGNWRLDESSGTAASDTVADGYINESAKTVTVLVPAGTAVTALIPRITTSPLSTVSPLSGVVQNFTSPVIYTVRAEDLTTQAYNVTVAVPSAISDADGNGIPDAWELLYFSGIGATSSAICSNGFNTVSQAYIAGLNPNDPQSRFMITNFRSLSEGKAFDWNTVSGRIYSVYWTTNLLNAFQPLETNIPWTRCSFTNSATVPQGFYKVNVQMAD
jgi:hypothetical protein